jgi:hypothetical protein
MAKQPTYDPAQIRSILIECFQSPPFLTNAETCKRYGLTLYRLQKHRKAMGHQRRSFEELVLTALHMSSRRHRPDGDSVDNLNGVLDYINHATYRPETILVALDSLVKTGFVVRTGDTWRPVKTRADLFLYVPPGND